MTGVRFDIQAHDKTGRAFQSVKRGLGSVNGAVAGVSRAFNSMATLVAGALTGAVAKSILDTGDRIHKLGQQLEISTEIISEYRLAAELTGSSMETFAKGMTKLGKSVSDATNGLSTPKRAFEELEISVEEIKSLNIDEQFEVVAEAISKVENPAQRVRIAMDIMGRSGTELLPALSGGAEGLRAMREEAQQLGLTLSQEDAETIAEFNDSLTRLKLSMEALARTILVNILPAITDLSDGIKELMVDGETSSKFFNELGLGFLGIANSVGLVSDEMLDLAADEAFERINENQKKINRTFREFKEVGIESADDVAESLKKVREEQDNLDRIADKIKSGLKTPVDKFNDSVAELNLVMDAGKITQSEYNAELERLRTTLDKTNEKTATLTKQTEELNFIQKLTEEGLKGEIKSWEDLGRVAINILQDIINQKIKAASVGGSGGSGDILGSLFSLGTSFFGGGSFASTGGIPPGGFAAATGVPFAGFANGGSFKVGGSGGTDKTPVSFMATRGEQVTVKTPGQQGKDGIIINYNIDAKGASPGVSTEIIDALKKIDSSIESRAKRVVQNEVQRNPAFLVG